VFADITEHIVTDIVFGLRVMLAIDHDPWDMGVFWRKSIGSGSDLMLPFIALLSSIAFKKGLLVTLGTGFSNFLNIFIILVKFLFDADHELELGQMVVDEVQGTGFQSVEFTLVSAMLAGEGVFAGNAFRLVCVAIGPNVQVAHFEEAVSLDGLGKGV
jgi:hypothetical protein